MVYQTTPPDDLEDWQKRVWSIAYQDGFKCGHALGYQEQNPYTLNSPLFNPWRLGWFDAIESLDLRQLEQSKCTWQIKHKLDRMWNETIRQTKYEKN